MPRARAIDWLRGIAALVMVQCHALVLVRPEARTSWFADFMAFTDGLVAPAFYLCAGFALAYTLVGAARKSQVPRRALRVTVRTAQVLAVSAALTSLWFPILSEPRWLLRIDVLSCIGLSLFALMPVCALLAKWPRLLGGVLLGLAAAIWIFAPALSRIHGPLSPLLGISSGSVFPPIPWGGHLAFGAGAGALLASGVQNLRLWSILAFASVAAMGLLWLASPIFGQHDPWCEPWTQLIRVGTVCVFAYGLTQLEVRIGERVAGPVRRAVEWYGTTSLWLYALHEVWLYTPRFGFCFNDTWGGKLGWGGYALATLGLIAAATLTVGVVELASWIAKRALQIVRGNQPKPDAKLVA